MGEGEFASRSLHSLFSPTSKACPAQGLYTVALNKTLLPSFLQTQEITCFFWELPTPSQYSMWNENDKGVDYTPAGGPREDRVDYRGAEKGDLTELGCYLNKRHPFTGLGSNLLPWSRFKLHSENVCLIGMSHAYASRKGWLQTTWLSLTKILSKGKESPLKAHHGAINKRTQDRKEYTCVYFCYLCLCVT